VHLHSIQKYYGTLQTEGMKTKSIWNMATNFLRTANTEIKWKFTFPTLIILILGINDNCNPCYSEKYETKHMMLCTSKHDNEYKPSKNTQEGWSGGLLLYSGWSSVAMCIGSHALTGTGVGLGRWAGRTCCSECYACCCMSYLAV